MDTDVIVIGGGPAGYTAALYAARSGFSVTVLEKQGPGGQMSLTQQIDNYPGFPQGVDGIALGMRMQEGAHRFGVNTKYAQVTEVQLTGEVKTVKTARDTYTAKAVVIATGAHHKSLGIPGEEALIGKGISYCAACDGMFYKGKTVAVVGGGNTAAAAALVLEKIAKKVYLIHRRDKLRAAGVYRKALEETPNITFLWNSQVKQLHSDEKLTGVRVENLQTGQWEDYAIDGLFVSVGQVPQTRLFEGQLELDEQGYIRAGEDTKTNLPGVYAAGDVRTKGLRQVVTAVADGAVAAQEIEAYLLRTPEGKPQ